MSQYDVYPNPDPRTRDRVPFVVDVQSNLLAGLPSRLVMPLSRVGTGMRPDALPTRLTPLLSVVGEPLLLLAYQAAAVDTRLLKQSAASLADHAFEIRDAMDAVLSGV